MHIIKTDKVVAVAMSGGVDSSVSAIMLKKRGFKVIGVTMHLVPQTEKGGGGGLKTCCGTDDIIDAKRVCVKLGIPHFTVNMEKEFEKAVIDPFINEYVSGRTPNPCISCNCFMKFDILRKRVKELGADMLATGHYARITRNISGDYFLLRAKDRAKEQSYVLYGLKPEDIREVIFPLGGMDKKTVRKVAAEAGFDRLSAKRESMEICFIPDNDYPGFIRRKMGAAENGNNSGNSACLTDGPIKNGKGEIVGRHKGIFNYTVGQRKGLGISSPNPLYVLRISPETNEITVGGAEETLSDNLTASNFNFINPKDAERLKYMKLTAKVRYSSPDYRCSAEAFAAGNGFSVKIVFTEKIKFIAPGQSAVLYDGLKVVGGGVIA